MRIADKIWFASLMLIDRLFATSLLERELARRKARLEHYEARLAQMREQLVKLEELFEAANLQLCLLYLQQRQLLWSHRWLQFDPADPHEDQGLDLLIEHLVRPRLAAIEVQKVEENRYLYKLEPDWNAIDDFFARRGFDLQPEIADWLRDDSVHCNSSQRIVRSAARPLKRSTELTTRSDDPA